MSAWRDMEKVQRYQKSERERERWREKGRERKRTRDMDEREISEFPFKMLKFEHLITVIETDPYLND